MKTRYSLELLLVLLLAISSSAQASMCGSDEIDLLPRLLSKYLAYEELGDIASELKTYKKYVANAKRFNNQTDPNHVQYANDFRNRISPFIQRANAIHFLGNLNEDLQTATPEGKNAIIKSIKRTLHFVYTHYRMALMELSEDPFVRNNSTLQYKVSKWLKDFGPADSDRTDYLFCVGNSLVAAEGKANKTSMARTVLIENCLKQGPLAKMFQGEGQKSFIEELRNLGLEHPGHPISLTGFIGGNKPTLFTENPWDKKTFKWYEQHLPVFQQLGYLQSDGTPQDVAFYRKNYVDQGKRAFEEFEEGNNGQILPISELLKVPSKLGFRRYENHPGFQRGIFRELIEAIRSTHQGGESIFIDIFFLGETIGVVFAHELISAMEANPNLKVFILRDQINHYGHGNNMLPIFNYLRAYSEAHPRQLIILPAHLDDHVTGLPDWMNFGIPENAQSWTPTSSPLSPMAKSDHSKVMVINGTNLQKAVAYVSSKNWLDSSGGITYDELVKIEGPAALVVQDNYIPDMMAALKRPDTREYMTSLYQANFPNAETSDLDLMAKRLIAPFDLLNRKDGLQSDAYLADGLCAKKRGNAIISIGENNHNSQIRSALDQDAYLILNSTKKIYVADQFFAEPKLVDATVRATTRSRNPVEVDILLTSISGQNKLPDNFPNILFVDKLLNESDPNKLRFRWKKIYETAHMQQEFHKKALTGGGPGFDVHISGSANKGFMTLRGAFRETQVMIIEDSGPRETHRNIAKQAIEVFEKDFQLTGGHQSLISLEDFHLATEELATRAGNVAATPGLRQLEEMLQPSKPPEENSGAIETRLDYQLPKSVQAKLGAIRMLLGVPTYKLFKGMRHFIDGFFNPYSFSLPPSEGTPPSAPAGESVGEQTVASFFNAEGDQRSQSTKHRYYEWVWFE